MEISVTVGNAVSLGCGCKYPEPDIKVQDNIEIGELSSSTQSPLIKKDISWYR
jgi:hypothetical protein